MSISRIIARYSETDQMGIIHHSQYVNWFEVGRTDLIREAGKSYNQLEQEGLWLPVIKVEVNYKEPSRYEDAVLVHTSIDSYNGVRIRFKYTVIKEKNQNTAVIGYTEHCWTNNKMKPLSLTKKEPELHETLLRIFKETNDVS